MGLLCTPSNRRRFYLPPKELPLDRAEMRWRGRESYLEVNGRLINDTLAMSLDFSKDGRKEILRRLNWEGFA